MKVFVEIGSNCFDTLEHLALEGWRGVMVEPVKRYYDRLKFLPNVQYYNVAIIHDREESLQPMYVFDDTVVQGDADFAGMSTLRTDVFPLTNTHVEWVPCWNVRKLLAQAQLLTSRIDLLKIDTEGYDANILQQFDLRKHQVQTVIVEYKHCGYDAIARLLADQCYSVIQKDASNVIAVPSAAAYA